MRLLLSSVCSILILAFSSGAQAAQSDEMQKMYSKETLTNGSMDVFSTEDGSRVKSIFTATNGTAISLESTKNTHDMAIGTMSLSVSRLASGNVKVVTTKGGEKSTRVYTKAELAEVQPADIGTAFDENGSGMSASELEAYSEYVAFMQQNQPHVNVVPIGDQNSVISLKCGLYVVGTGIIGIASAEACVASLGWTCAAGVVGTIMAWDATMGVCGL